MVYERKIIEGYPGYAIDTEGVVWSAWKRGPKRRTGEFYKMKYGINRHFSGYNKPQYTIRNSEGTKTVTSARLVAKHFIPNPNNLPIVRHINNDPFDNKVENLLWGTQQDNIEDRQKQGRQARGEKQWSSKLTSSDIKEIFRLRKIGETYVSIANRYSVNWKSIYYIIKRKTWKHILINN